MNAFNTVREFLSNFPPIEYEIESLIKSFVNAVIEECWILSAEAYPYDPALVSRSVKRRINNMINFIQMSL